MTIKLLPKDIKKFQQEILAWYEKNKRDLPWRDAPVTTSSSSGASFQEGNIPLRDPYKILISEVMSQQTQISRVVPKYLAWIEQFPTVESLANASTRDVLAAWSGLGYNRRALYLKKCAEVLVSRKQSVILEQVKRSDRIFSKGKKILSVGDASFQDDNLWPTTEEELKKLPGIGDYTARALLCFAFNKQVAVVDTNVRKVILTHFSYVILNDSEGAASGKLVPLGQSHSKNKDSSASLRFAQNDEKQIKQIAEQLLPQGRAYEWNQALMDYASAMLKQEKIPPLRQGFAGQAVPFKTSNRFYRGQVLRLLLAHTKETIESLFEKIENNGISKEKFEEILGGMEKDGLVVRQGKEVSLGS